MVLQEHWEFGGPTLGPLVVMLSLPVVCYLLYFSCNATKGCLALTRSDRFFLFSLTYPEMGITSATLFTWDAMWIVLAYLAWILGLHVLLPGKHCQGATLPDGTRLTYKLNAFPVCVVTLFTAIVTGPYLRWIDLTWVSRNFLPLLSSSIIVSTGLAVYLYLASFAPGAMLAAEGSSGRPVYDFFLGRELNPRLRLSPSSSHVLDLKEWCELYPGMIGWVLVNLSMLVSQYERHGHVTNSMWMVNAFHLIYLIDALVNEPAILTTMDITTDGFGWMLTFGDLTWVPFTYSVQARYLADFPVELSSLGVVAILGLKGLGYWIFRGANSQKDQFRRDPTHASVRNLKTLSTQRGRKLLVDGWWKIARHINYTGDWLMGVAWCLPCGFNHLTPYFYAVYFLSLLLHRDSRDFHSCKVKYGADWDKYCSIVKFSMFPGIY